MPRNCQFLQATVLIDSACRRCLLLMIQRLQRFLEVCTVGDPEVRNVSKNWCLTSLTAVGCLVLMAVCAVTTLAKRTDDVVVMKNGDRMTGEIKNLQRGELLFKASYMAEAVRLDWAQVAQLESKDNYQIYMADGHRFAEQFKLEGTSEGDFKIGSAGVVKVNQMDVLRILPIESKFWRQLEGSVDLGLSFTSGNDQYQTSLFTQVTYRRGDNSITTQFDSSFSGQTRGTKSARNQFDLDYRRRVSPRWYVGGLFDALRSDQQSLDWRLTAGGVLGRTLLRTERTRLSAFGGLAGNREKYKVVPERHWTTNADAIGGLEFTTFRFNAMDISSHFIVFPSLTTPGRLRTQVKSDLRIKLAKDFWWGFHVYENFDSKPPIKANKNDLGVSASIGWKF